MDWGLPNNGNYFATNVDSGGPSGASANTLGAYSEIVASTVRQTDLLDIAFRPVDFSGQWLTSFALGASGSEVDFITNIPDHQPSSNNTHHGLLIPVNIPAGSRISARTQNDSTGNSNHYFLRLWSRSNHATPQTCSGNPDTYGADPTTSRGSTLTLGSYVEMTPATTRQYQGLYLMKTGSDESNISMSFDVAIGASGAEVAIYSIPSELNRAGGIHQQYHHIPVAIPAGTRLSIKKTLTGGGSQSSYGMILGY